MTVKVAKITIELGRKTLELTPEEVSELQNALNTLYPPPKEVIRDTVYLDRYRYWNGWPLGGASYSVTNRANANIGSALTENTIPEKYNLLCQVNKNISLKVTPE